MIQKKIISNFNRFMNTSSGMMAGSREYVPAGAFVTGGVEDGSVSTWCQILKF